MTLALERPQAARKVTIIFTGHSEDEEATKEDSLYYPYTFLRRPVGVMVPVLRPSERATHEPTRRLDAIEQTPRHAISPHHAIDAPRHRPTQHDAIAAPQVRETPRIHRGPENKEHGPARGGRPRHEALREARRQTAGVRRRAPVRPGVPGRPGVER